MCIIRMYNIYEAMQLFPISFFSIQFSMTNNLESFVTAEKCVSEMFYSLRGDRGIRIVPP
jgi:hypothetical protein